MVIKAPKKFVFAPSDKFGMISFLNKVLKAKGDSIIIDVSTTEEISEGGFLALKAQVEKAVMSSSRRLLFIINNPKSRFVRDFLKTKFNKHESSQKTEFHVNMSIGKDVKIDTVTDPTFVDKIVKGLKKVGIKEYFDPFYDYLVELIGNATEHGIKNRNLNWWLIHYRDRKTNSMCYVFVDMGVGIAGSHRDAGLPLKYRLSADKHIVKNAFSGNLGSSTKQKNRGNGLPFIKEIVEKGYLSNFLLISNRVSASEVDGNLVYSRNRNFVGTYYSWSINKENVLLWKNSR